MRGRQRPQFPDYHHSHSRNSCAIEMPDNLRLSTMTSRGERLQEALAERGVRKQMALAAELGVDESAISRWQRDAGLSLNHAARLCEVLDISLDWLVLGRGDMDLHRRAGAASAEREVGPPLAPLPEPIAAAMARLASVISSELS